MKNSLPYRIITQIICLIVLVIVMFPLCLMIEKSFAVNGFGNYVKVFEYFNLIPNVITSIIVVGGTLLVVGVVVSMASFAFSKLHFPGKRAVYYLLLTGMMIPTSALIFPLYQIVRGLQLNNTGWSLIFPYATASACFNLMILTNYYNALPDELIDAARIDGAGKWKTFRMIMLPIAKPGLVFILIQTFLTSWNELQMAMIFINDTSKQPMSVVPLRFAQTTTSTGFTINNLFAACIICLFPIAVFYTLASRQLMEGLTAGAVKG
ncbi:MAG: carbohydrate ABC transporter permease [Blautia sp.]|nr:carbohydrate ABC transporter permease [Blautia sp.]MDY3997723.1 carbohydrate ABC transporter permease [Blautia sp.]